MTKSTKKNGSCLTAPFNFLFFFFFPPTKLPMSPSLSYCDTFACATAAEFIKCSYGKKNVVDAL